MSSPAATIAWLADPSGPGCWGPPEDLALPISDRGLLLADGVFETLLVEGGRAWLLEEHLDRWQRSAALLALPPPPGVAIVQPLITEAIQRSGIGSGRGSSGALRLNWSRGSGGAGGGGSRGIAIPSACTPSFWLQLSAIEPCFEPVRVIVSPTEERSATSLLSRCKSFAYGPSIQARRQAREAGADDALLRSTAGGLCCGTTANLLLRRNGSWITPPLSHGCLPGVMRQQALDRGLLVEQPIQEQDLTRCEAAWLINSLGCRPISHLDATPLAGEVAGSSLGGEAETFWRQLLLPRRG
ncbi:aminotransferase class IV [Synechococcus sp. 8F6]|uniref:aminotransferase class IV n=1 Tax=Synechococcus sp. 8F6 TaxID=2025606 RepID=UPI000B983B02|nr:aminotransferase class IV [Synechococcus sp. 8F6]